MLTVTLILDLGGFETAPLFASVKGPLKPGKNGISCTTEIGVDYKSWESYRVKGGFTPYQTESPNDPYLTQTITEEADSTNYTLAFPGSQYFDSPHAITAGTFNRSASGSYANVGSIVFYFAKLDPNESGVTYATGHLYHLGPGCYTDYSAVDSSSVYVNQDVQARISGVYNPSNVSGCSTPSVSISRSITFTPDSSALGTQTSDYVDGITACSPQITGQLYLTSSQILYYNPTIVSGHEEYYSQQGVYTPGRQRYVLSNKYNTAKLMELTTADLTKCTIPEEGWGQGKKYVTTVCPAHCDDVLASSTAYRNLAADESNLTLRRLEYRLSVRIPKGEQTLIEWLERQTDLLGNVIHDEHKQKWVTGTGDVQYIGPYSIDPPSVNGSVSVVLLSNEPKPCPCILGGTKVEGGKLYVQNLLGKTEFGEGAGSLFINSTNPSALLGTPVTLKFLSLDNGAQVISTNGALRQVKVTQGLADVVTNTATQYQIKFYTNSGSMSGGLYVPSGSAVTTMQVELVGGSTNHVRFTVSGMGADTIDYYWSDADQGWSTTMGNDNYIEQRLWNTNSLLETNIVYNANLDEVSRTKTTYMDLAGDAGRVVTSMVTDPEGAALTTQLFYINDTNSPNHGRMSMKVMPDGGWEKYGYDSLSRITNTVQQFGNNATNSADASNRVLVYDYTAQGSGDVGTNDLYTPRLTIEKLLGQEIKRSYNVILANGFKEIVCPYPGLALTNSLNEVTITTLCTNGTFIDRPLLVNHPDGTITGYIYSRTSTDETVTVGIGQPDGTGTNVYNGQKTVTVTGLAGQVNSVSTYEMQSGVATLIDQQTYAYNDPMYRSHTITYLDGRTETSTYDCCGLASSIDKDGTQTDFTYDDLHRQVATTTLGITHTNILDTLGRTLASQRIGTNGNTITLSQNLYDESGRLLASTNALLGATSYLTTTNGSSEKVITTTYPDGGTRIETYYKDGNLKSLTGTAVQPVRYEYGIVSDGGYYRAYTKEIKLDSSYADTAEWTQSYSDGLGRTYKTAFAGSGSPYQQSWYNNKGQLWKQRDPDGVIALTSYDSQGRPFYQAVDVNQNDVVNTNGLDRVSFTLSDVVSAHSTTVRRARTYAHLVDNSTSFDLLSMSEQSTDGLKSWQTSYRDASTAVQSSSVTSYGGGGSRTVTTTSPDGSYSISLYSYGVLQSVNRYAYGGASIGSTTYGYDAHGRANAVTDARNGTTSMTFNNADQVVSTTSPPPGNGQAAQVTATIYDNMGRATNVVYPDGNQMSQEYFVSGLLKKSSGSRTYPVEYTYDSQGRMKTMKTWQDFTGNSGTATTTWNYDPYRGWLASKDYPDASTGAAGTVGPDYGYSPAGRLTTNQWARIVSGSTRLTKTVSYGTGGDISNVSYNDSGVTPGVSFDYDRLGRKKSVISNGMTNSFLYNLASQPTEESWSGGTLNTWKVNPFYDSYLRRNQFKVTKLTTLQIQHDYSYDNASRLQKVWQGSYSANYSYEPNSSLIDKVEYKYNSTTTRLTADRTYDKLNRLTSMANTPQSGIPVSFAYQYNDANQRIHTTLADGSYWAYEYDSLGQVVSGRRFWSDNTPVAGQQFEYQFDDIGNRKTGRAGGDSNGYGLRGSTNTVNRLNQYASRTVPGGFDILGVATATSSVSVNSLTAERKGEYFWKQVDASNSSTPVWKTNTISVTGVSSVTGKSWVSQTPESYTHDADGNLTADGRWNYTWDGENRLIRMVARTTTGPQQRIDFEYDYQGRRIRKKVWDNTAGTGSPSLDLKFIYDGWNLMAEVNGSDALVRQYMWGLDLSGTFQGAGGVGGLVKFFDHSTTVHNFVACDGNGNVALLVRGDTGAVVGNCDYGPFGEVIRATGPMAKANPFRWSTQYTDDETDLVMYPARPYNPSSGRFLCKDPIEELGGLNLYAFVGNNPVNRFDPFGLKDYKKGTDDPTITPDPGAGAWDSEEWTWSNLALKQLIVNNIGIVWIGMPDAVNHVRHYFGNSGSDYTIRLQKMIDDVPSAKRVFNTEVGLAQAFVESLPDGKHSITSGSTSGGYNGKSESKNWYYAVGGYSAWGKGNATVCKDEYTLEFQYKFYDRYNWDTGKSVTILGQTVTDAFMGEFHRQGLAREFDMRGAVKKTIKWKKGQAPRISDGWESEQGR